MALARASFTCWCRPAAVLVAALALACGSGQEAAAPAAPPAPSARTAPAASGPGGSAATVSTPADLPQGLLVAISKFEKGPDGKPLPISELEVLVRRGGQWQARSYTDPESNVFHKAMLYTPPGEAPGVVTLGGTAAVVKLWRLGPKGLAPVATYWKKDFGGKWSRMRDAEVADLFGDGRPAIAVATHDQGVVAILRPRPGGGMQVQEIDHQPNTFIHEIEVGDLDHDGVLEVYATPSEPNRLDGKPQKGTVVRYVPARGEGRKVVADLGQRHAKEILVHDVDGDGIDELYVSVEAAEGGDLEIRRYDADTPPSGGIPIATLADRMCRFLTAGDLDGDGHEEMVIAAKDSGLWLARPGKNPKARWSLEQIDAHSKGFEHAALLADLDGDGTDELYVASDDDKEIRRYVSGPHGFVREVIHRRSESLPVLTWNLMPAPVEVISP